MTQITLINKTTETEYKLRIIGYPNTGKYRRWILLKRIADNSYKEVMTDTTTAEGEKIIEKVNEWIQNGNFEKD